MIIGEALRKIFEGITVQYEYDDQLITSDVKFHYGSQIELNNWIALNNSNNLENFPLIWYVQDKYTDFQGKKKTFSRLILFMSTEPFWMNDTRTMETYTKVLEPLYDKVVNRLLEHPHVRVYAQRPYEKFEVLDEPNYGVGLGDKQDFTTTQTKGEKGIAIAIVDAKVLDFYMEIEPKCIIN